VRRERKQSAHVREDRPHMCESGRTCDRSVQSHVWEKTVCTAARVTGTAAHVREQNKAARVSFLGRLQAIQLTSRYSRIQVTSAGIRLTAVCSRFVSGNFPKFVDL
jgi:hypothetical protein